MVKTTTSKEEFLKAMLKKAQEKDVDAEPYDPADLKTEDIEKTAEDIKKFLAEKAKKKKVI